MDADTAFHVGNAVFKHSSVNDVTVSNVTTTVAGPGVGLLTWRNILQFDVINPHNFSEDTSRLEYRTTAG